MHLETLDAVHQESKRLPPIPKVVLALFLLLLLFVMDYWCRIAGIKGATSLAPGAVCMTWS